MKNLRTQLLVFLVAILLPFIGNSQYYMQYFDGADTNGNAIQIIIDTANDNIWQIGKPQKQIFDSAATWPNSLITDTLNSYPTNNVSKFSYYVNTNSFFNGGIIAIQWKQKLDMDLGQDGGMIEFSLDSGQTWQNAFDNPNVYNFYGFDSINVDTLPNGELGFTGTDSTWKDIWLCFGVSWMSNYPNMLVRHTLVSDSVENSMEGWVIDNLMVHITIVHTVEEVEKKDYLTVGPNPTNGRVEIQTQKVEGYHVIENIELVNIEGKVIQQWGVSPTKFFVDIQNHPNGVYFLRVKTNIKSETFKIVLEK